MYIENPVIISSVKYGGRFVISKTLLSKFENNQIFFNRPDVFLLGENLYFDLDYNDYGRFKYPDNGNCELKKSTLTIKDVEIYEYENVPKHFLLGLINVNFYNIKHNAENFYQIKERNQKISYYKIVYPLCE